MRLALVAAPMQPASSSASATFAVFSHARYSQLGLEIDPLAFLVGVLVLYAGTGFAIAARKVASAVARRRRASRHPG